MIGTASNLITFKLLSATTDILFNGHCNTLSNSFHTGRTSRISRSIQRQATTSGTPTCKTSSGQVRVFKISQNSASSTASGTSQVNQQATSSPRIRVSQPATASARGQLSQQSRPSGRIDATHHAPIIDLTQQSSPAIRQATKVPRTQFVVQRSSLNLSAADNGSGVKYVLKRIDADSPPKQSKQIQYVSLLPSKATTTQPSKPFSLSTNLLYYRSNIY